MENQIQGQDSIKDMIRLAVECNLPALLIGDTGTGKTSMIREIANAMDKQMIRVNLNGQTSVDEFVGKWLIKNQETIWIDGILIQAMKKGWWLLCDEINAALPEILFVLHSLLDDDRMVVLSEKDGEIVRPHEDFRFFATMNPSDEYSGTKELNKAFISRFGVVVNVEYPTFEVETAILIGRQNVPQAVAETMVGYAKCIRELKEKGEIYFTFSTRDLLFWAELYNQTKSIEKSFEYGILHKASKEDKIQLLKTLSFMGQDLAKLNESQKVDNFKGLIEKYKEQFAALEAKEIKLTKLKEETDAKIKEIQKEVVDKVMHSLQATIKSSAKKQINKDLQEPTEGSLL